MRLVGRGATFRPPKSVNAETGQGPKNGVGGSRHPDQKQQVALLKQVR